MNKNVGIATAAGIAIIAGAIIFQLNSTTWSQVTVEEYYEKGGRVPSVVYPENPQFLGPLQINKDKYLLGENVFAVLKNLQPGDKGSILFVTPEGIVYDEWIFDGNVKEYYKKYFKPQLLLSKNLCQKEQLVGQWSVMFKGYEEMQLNFEMMGDTLPNSEYMYVECSIAYEVDPTKQESVVPLDEPQSSLKP